MEIYKAGVRGLAHLQLQSLDCSSKNCIDFDVDVDVDIDVVHVDVMMTAKLFSKGDLGEKFICENLTLTKKICSLQLPNSARVFSGPVEELELAGLTLDCHRRV